MLSSHRLLLLAWACLWLASNAQADDLDNYVFVPDTNRWVEFFQGRTSSIGKLDAAGNFIPGLDYVNQPRGQARSGVQISEPLNIRAEKNVCEFRSGRLIKGEIDATGNFIPEVGSKVIDFKDYRYRPGGPRIWNLPGRFEKKTKTS